MGEWRDPEEEDPFGDWLALIESCEQNDMQSMADQMRAAGPPPMLGTLNHSFVIIDTDIGGDADDAVAVAVAAAWLPELALVVTSDECAGERARFARHLLDLVGRPDVPVVAGADLGNRKYLCVEDLIPDEIPQQATDLDLHLRRICSAATLPVRWVGMGPLSNLHRLHRQAPELAGKLDVTQMGGALRYRDPSRAEHNFRLDPAAATGVLASAHEPQLVTSDVTFTIELGVDENSRIYRALARSDAPPWADLLRRHLDRWFDRFYPSTIQHDALTLAAAMELPFVGFTRTRVQLDDQARMRSEPDGVPIWMSSRAYYEPFMAWLAQQIEDAVGQHVDTDIAATGHPHPPPTGSTRT